MEDTDSLASELRLQKKRKIPADEYKDLFGKKSKISSNDVNKKTNNWKLKKTVDDKEPIQNVSATIDEYDDNGIPKPPKFNRDFYNPVAINNSNELLEVKQKSNERKRQLTEDENELYEIMKKKKLKRQQENEKQKHSKHKNQKRKDVDSSGDDNSGSDSGSESGSLSVSEEDEKNDRDQSDNRENKRNRRRVSQDEDCDDEDYRKEMKYRNKLLRRNKVSTEYDPEFEELLEVIQEKQKYVEEIKAAMRLGILSPIPTPSLKNTYFDLKSAANFCNDTRTMNEQIDQCEQVILMGADAISKHHGMIPLMKKLKLKGFHAGLEAMSSKLRDCLEKIYREDGSLPHMPAKAWLLWTIGHCAAQVHAAESKLEKRAEKIEKEEEEKRQQRETEGMGGYQNESFQSLMDNPKLQRLQMQQKLEAENLLKQKMLMQQQEILSSVTNSTISNNNKLFNSAIPDLPNFTMSPQISLENKNQTFFQFPSATPSPEYTTYSTVAQSSEPQSRSSKRTLVLNPSTTPNTPKTNLTLSDPVLSSSILKIDDNAKSSKVNATEDDLNSVISIEPIIELSSSQLAAMTSN